MTTSCVYVVSLSFSLINMQSFFLVNWHGCRNSAIYQTELLDDDFTTKGVVASH